MMSSTVATLESAQAWRPSSAVQMPSERTPLFEVEPSSEERDIKHLTARMRPKAVQYDRTYPKCIIPMMPDGTGCLSQFVFTL
ncbi:hypothetical protein ABKN59_005367 [Abortiporus biennis]